MIIHYNLLLTIIVNRHDKPPLQTVAISNINHYINYQAALPGKPPATAPAHPSARPKP